MKKEFLQSIKFIALATIITLGLNYAYAWTDPSSAPTGGNTPAPINVSSTGQAKGKSSATAGTTLDIGGKLAADALAVWGDAKILGNVNFGPDNSGTAHKFNNWNKSNFWDDVNIGGIITNADDGSQSAQGYNLTIYPTSSSQKASGNSVGIYLLDYKDGSSDADKPLCVLPYNGLVRACNGSSSGSSGSTGSSSSATTITSSGSYTVPSGVYSISAVVIGGGGAGGGNGTNNTDSCGGGGGAGGMDTGVIAVYPGLNLSITVGAGGQAGGGGGGTSKITAGGINLQAGGGYGGQQTVSTAGYGGGGGDAGSCGKSNNPHHFYSCSDAYNGGQQGKKAVGYQCSVAGGKSYISTYGEGGAGTYTSGNDGNAGVVIIKPL